MNKYLVTILIINLLHLNAHSQIFENYFLNSSLRVDYMHTATHDKELLSLDTYYHEPNWGGSQVNLIDTFDYGHYRFEVYDSLTNTLIYSRGYSTLCGEWRYTSEAKKTWRSFSESIILPFPKAPIKIVFFKRKINQTWKQIFNIDITPSDYSIVPQLKTELDAHRIHYSGNPSKKLDIVLLAEGYTKKEIKKFIKDAKRFANYLFNCAPFDKMKTNINIWAVSSISSESGTDIPGEGIYKNTFFDSHFYTFGTERYINTVNNIAVRNAAANAPYDQIYIIANTEKYGGAGIYNYYSICTSDHNLSDFVFIHELGHSFAGLGDEYIDKNVAVEDFYDLNTEPWEPNLTTLQDFESKWKHLCDTITKIPTIYQNRQDKTVGAFEGAGYVTKGVYRPRSDCTMRSVNYNYFCPVCTKAIIDMINFYSN